MTEAEAEQLKPGDRVQIATAETSRGTVFRNFDTSVAIRWDSGDLVLYGHETIPHIRAIPQGQSKRAETGSPTPDSKT